jgi:hypothetical protein
MDNKELYRDISDSERMERDWQMEQRVEARFLDETYNDWQAVNVCGNCGAVVEKLIEFFGCGECEVCAAEPRKKVPGQQLNLFEEAA